MTAVCAFVLVGAESSTGPDGTDDVSSAPPKPALTFPPTPVVCAAFASSYALRTKYTDYARQFCVSRTWDQVVPDGSVMHIEDNHHEFFLKRGSQFPQFIAGVAYTGQVTLAEGARVADLVLGNFVRDVCPVAGTIVEHQYSRKIAKGFEDALQSVSKVAKVQAEVDGLVTVMQGAIAATVQRGYALEKLQDDTQLLNASAGMFNRQATILKKNMRCRNWKLTALVVVAVLVVVAIIVAVVAAAVAV